MPYATNDGVRIYYEVEGDGPDLVLHVGFQQRLHDWRRDDVGVAQAMRAHYRLVLIDPLGQGASDKPHEASAYTLERRVGDVIAVLDAEGIDQAHFWGYSLGGQFGIGLGVSAPERVRSLIIGGADPYDRDPTRHLRDAAALRRGSMADYVAAWEATAGPLPPTVRAAWLDNDPLALAAHCEARSAYPDLGAVLSTVHLPTLFYVGDQDGRFAEVARAAGVMPAATFVPLEGLNHSLAFRRGDLVLPHVRAFLAQLD